MTQAVLTLDYIHMLRSANRLLCGMPFGLGSGRALGRASAEQGLGKPVPGIE